MRPSAFVRRSSGWASGYILSIPNVLRGHLGNVGAGLLAVSPVPGSDGTL